MTATGEAVGAANTESYHNQPLSARALPEKHAIAAAAIKSVAGFAICLKAVIGKLLSLPPTKPNVSTISNVVRLGRQYGRRKPTQFEGKIPLALLARMRRHNHSVAFHCAKRKAALPGRP